MQITELAEIRIDSTLATSRMRGPIFVALEYLSPVSRMALSPARTSIPDALFDWLAPSLDASESRAHSAQCCRRQCAREREALAKPIPGPPPLPPITAKLAYGHLKPGGNGHAATAEKKPKLPKNGLTHGNNVSANSFRASSAVIPEMHKVYYKPCSQCWPLFCRLSWHPLLPLLLCLRKHRVV